MTGYRPSAALAQAIAAARDQRVCLLCFERDHLTCRRSLVAEMIGAETSPTVTHLEAAL